jgi:hypothetical protein
MRKNFILADIFGVDFAGTITEYSNHNYQVISRNMPFIKEMPANLMPFGGSAADIKCKEGASLLMSFLKPLPSRYMPLTEKGSPALIFNKFGKGSSLYFASALENFYYDFNTPEYRWLIQAFIKRHISLPVELPTINDFPVEVVVRRQDTRHIIHLINYCSFDERPFVSIHNFNNLPIRVKIPLRNISIYSSKLNRYLEVKKAKTHYECILPTLEEYEVLVVE